eukprot:CAMPEP_0170489598 /NCGR_PEP_ID=MMETSP0208-20121228/7925_1 /TAXON_ID=197538 /ORGANISM="Strombidium inclinatum, Strain S3" /LENGTH=70 /DNA_ID=CAMNT_0010764585 /DNA_START=2157 /DNA_END=2369 /DNA_ORIENTATION=-
MRLHQILGHPELLLLVDLDRNVYFIDVAASDHDVVEAGEDLRELMAFGARVELLPVSKADEVAFEPARTA